MTADDRYAAAAALADMLQAELERLGRWSREPLPPEAFEDMGAFGTNTMSFEQWLQFVLLERIREIIGERGQFPGGAQLSVHAVRELDGDPDAERLIAILRKIDLLAGRSVPRLDDIPAPEPLTAPAAEPEPAVVDSETISVGGTKLPTVAYTMADLLPRPHYEGQDIDEQLQTFQEWLDILAPVVRPELSALFAKAAAAATDPARRERLERAARDVAAGGRILAGRG
jgi:uncharacterized protein YqcC (DUF446 family)